MGIFACSACAKGQHIDFGEDDFSEVYESQHGDWHCVSILEIDSAEAWNFHKTVGEGYNCPVIAAQCNDSDYAVVYLYNGGKLVDSFIIGESYEGERLAPNLDCWREFEVAGKFLESFLAENQSFIFAERVLIALKQVFGFPLIEIPWLKLD